MRTIEDARTKLRAALDAGDVEAARKAVRGWPPLRGPAEALLWTELLWADRDHPDRRPIAETLLEAWPEHGEIVHPCAEVLLDELGGFVPGEPADPQGLARRAVDALDRCLAARPDYGDEARLLLLRSRASALSRAAGVPVEEVEAAWEALLQAEPEDGGAWYELALWLKYRGHFRAGLAAALQAYRCLGPQESVLWNVGICATGCGANDRALEAWRALGMQAELDGERVVVPGLPSRRVRHLTTDDEGEIALELRIAPLGPCDGLVLDEVPAELPVRRGDRILHDATPLPGSEPPMLPGLALLRG